MVQFVKKTIGELFYFGSMIFGKDKMISYLYRFLLLVVPLI